MSELVALVVAVLMTAFIVYPSGKDAGRKQVFTGEYVCAYDIAKRIHCYRKEDLK